MPSGTLMVAEADVVAPPRIKVAGRSFRPGVTSAKPAQPGTRKWQTQTPPGASRGSRANRRDRVTLALHTKHDKRVYMAMHDGMLPFPRCTRTTVRICARG